MEYYCMFHKTYMEQPKDKCFNNMRLTKTGFKKGKCKYFVVLEKLVKLSGENNIEADYTINEFIKFFNQQAAKKNYK